MSQSYESAPQAPPGPPPGGPSGPRANFGQRLGAYLIDAILIGVVVVVLYYISTIAVPDRSARGHRVLGGPRRQSSAVRPSA